MHQQQNKLLRKKTALALDFNFDGISCYCQARSHLSSVGIYTDMLADDETA